MFVGFQRDKQCHVIKGEHEDAGWAVYIVPINWSKVAVVVVQDETMSAGYYVKVVAYTKQKGSPHGFLVVHDFEWEEGIQSSGTSFSSKMTPLIAYRCIDLMRCSRSIRD